MNYTVKQLRECIAGLPDDMLVIIDQVGDKYFNNPKSGWVLQDVDWELYSWAVYERCKGEFDYEGHPDFRMTTLDIDKIERESPEHYRFIQDNRDHYGPNYEMWLQQTKGCTVFQAYKTFSRTLNEDVLYITPHY